MEKPKRLEDQRYFLENIIQAITFWYDTNRGADGTPTAVGAIVQRYAGIYLGKRDPVTGHSDTMDDLRDEAKEQLKIVNHKIAERKLEKQLGQLKRDLSAQLLAPPLWGSPFVLSPKDHLVTTKKTRREELEGKTVAQIRKLWQEAKTADLKKHRIDYILEAEKKY